MIEFFIKSTAAMGALLGLYYILFEREKMHRFNRFYLLSALLFSLALPFVTIPVYVEAKAEAVEVTQESVVPNIQLADNDVQKQPIINGPVSVLEPPVNYWPYIGWGIYLAITLLLAAKFIINMFRFYRLKKHNPTTTYQGATIILLDKNVLPHTFLGNIYLNRKEYENRLIEPELFDHEFVHVKQYHTVDILFIEILKTIFWFNPLLHFYKRAIQLNHEFLADEKVIAATNNVQSYQQLLLDKASFGKVIALASNLNFSVTKKRLIMMTKTTNQTKALLLKFAALPVAVGLIYLLSTETVLYAKENGIKPAIILNSLTEGISSEFETLEITDSVEQTPTPVISDTINGDSRRDEYFKGVQIVIEDKLNGVSINKPYEKLTPEQKRHYLSSIPDKKSAEGVSEEDYKFSLNLEDGIFYIDDKKVKKDDIIKLKREHFAYFSFKGSGMGTKEGRLVGTYQIFFYTYPYFNKNIKSINDHYPEKTYKVTILDVAEEYKPETDEYTLQQKSLGKSDLQIMEEMLAKDISGDTYPQTKNLKEGVFNVAATFPGGYNKFQEYMASNLRLGDKKDNQFYIHFTVNTDGSISEVTLYDENDPEITEEVKRVLLNSPRWVPAQKNGKPHKTSTTFKYPYKITK